MIVRGMNGLPNTLSVLRVALGLCLIPFDVGSLPFVAIYLCAGLTDVLDGWTARHTCSETELGAKLDTIGDTVLFIIVIVKVLLFAELSIWLLVWIVSIFVVKTFNIVFVYVRMKDVLSEHTPLNKLAGTVLFILPLAVPMTDPGMTTAVVCLVSTVAVVQETSVVCRRVCGPRFR